MGLDLSMLVSGLLTISLFFLLHFIVTPMNERRKSKIEQLTKLYSPLYGLLLARIKIGNDVSPNEFTLGNIRDHDYLEKEKFDKLIYDNLGYASIELINVWAKYSTSVGKINTDLQINISKVITKDFNQLRKDLKLPYNKSELKTGVPEIVVDKEKL